MNINKGNVMAKPLKDQIAMIIGEIKGMSEKIEGAETDKLLVYSMIFNITNLRQQQQMGARLENVEIKINRLMELMMNLPTQVKMEEQIQKLKIDISQLQADNDDLTTQLKYSQELLKAHTSPS